MSQEEKLESFYETTLNSLVFLTILTKQQYNIFIKLLGYIYTKASKDIKDGCEIEYLTTVSIANFQKKLGISERTVKRFNKKVRNVFSEYIEIERQKFGYGDVAGYQSVNKYTFQKELFYSLFLLHIKGILKDKKIVHNYLIQFSENKGLMKNLILNSKQKCPRSNHQNVPANNVLSNVIINLYLSFSTKKSAPPLSGVLENPIKDSSYDRLVPFNKNFGLSNLEVEKLLKNHSSSVVNLSIKDSIWYDQEEKNKIYSKFAYVSYMCSKVNDSYVKNQRKVS